MRKSCRKFKISDAHRVAAALMGIVMLFVVLFSAFYIAAEMEHHCTSEDCPICACIHQCENNIRQMGHGAAEQTFSILFAVFFAMPLSFHDIQFSQATLVTQKIRLNN